MSTVYENVGPEDDPMRALMSGIDQQNYAGDEEKCARFKEDIVDLMPMIETQRAPLEDRWNTYHHCWARKNTDATRFYTGVNDAYFPVAHSNIETLVAYLVGQLFGPGPKFAVKSPNPMVPPAIIQKATSTLEYFLHTAKVESSMPKHVRQACVMGSSIIKNVWRDEHVVSYSPSVQLDQNGQPQIVGNGQKIQKYLGPTFKVIDLLSIYLYPITAENLEDCEIVYEKIDRDFRDLKAMEAKGLLVGVDRLQGPNAGGFKETEAIRRDTNRNFRLAPYGMSTYQIKNKNLVVLNEVWCNFDLYGNGMVFPCKAVVANGHVLELRQNPLWHQRPPYRLWRCIKHQDHIYGMGLMELIEHHQSTLNAIVNQSLDANLYQTNQMMAINADSYQGLLGDIETTPLTVFPFSQDGHPVQDKIAFLKPENTAAQSFAVANIVAGSMSDTLGTPPVVSGKFTNKERTAREVSAVVAGASIRIDMMVRNLALETMQDWYEDCWELAQQNITQELELKATGMPHIPISPSDLNTKPLMYVITSSEAQEYLQAQAQQQAEMMAQAQLQGSNHPSTSGQQTPAGPSEGMGPSPMDGAGSP